MAEAIDGRNRTLTEADVRAIANATATAVVNNPTLIELITNIIDGALDVKLEPIQTRFDAIQAGLRMARGAKSS